MGGEMCREKSLRNGVHHANAVVWGPVYRTRLTRSRRRIPRIRRRPVDGLVVVRRRSATPARRRRARAAPSRARRSSASVWSAGALPPRGARRPRTTPNDGPRLPRRRRRLRSRAAWCSGRARRRRGRARTRRAAARRRARGPDRRSVCRFWGGRRRRRGEGRRQRRGEARAIDSISRIHSFNTRRGRRRRTTERRERAHTRRRRSRPRRRPRRRSRGAASRARSRAETRTTPRVRRECQRTGRRALHFSEKLFDSKRQTDCPSDATRARARRVRGRARARRARGRVRRVPQAQHGRVVQGVGGVQLPRRPPRLRVRGRGVRIFASARSARVRRRKGQDDDDDDAAGRRRRRRVSARGSIRRRARRTETGRTAREGVEGSSKECVAGEDPTRRGRVGRRPTRSITAVTMPSTDELLQSELWRGAVPCEIRLARDEVAEMSPPPPLYALVPRGAFLPLWHARDGRCATHFARSLPPGVGEMRLRLLPIRYDPVRVRGERRSLRRSFFFRALSTARFATRAP